MNDPIGYLLTWATYGTWLPGDARGWVDYQHGLQHPSPVRERDASAKMTEDVCLLSLEQRHAVEAQIAQTCRCRGWHLHAVNCRSNHIHVVVSASNIPPKKILTDMKAWATKCLKSLEKSLADASGYDDVGKNDACRENWWAERGSTRHLYNQKALDAAIAYVMEGQDVKRE